MGERLGSYCLGELLGAGGMGRVFAVEDASSKPLAVKLLHETLLGDPVLAARLADEARAARRVSHPNVVRVLDHGTHEGAPYLVMERAHGVPLGALIQERGPLSLVRVRTIASQILAGLAAVHRAGLVHGDIKSDNVLVDANDRVTLIDFGLARSQGSRPDWLDEHMLSGTPEYMAPELVMGQPITVAAELYAVGVIIYEMITGATPFGGGSTTAVFERHLTDEVVPPSLRCPNRTIPAPLESVIMRSLEKEPASRHFNAEMFATAIERSIPTTHVDQPPTRPFEHPSPTRPTNEWEHKSTVRRHVHPRRRFAEGTARRDTPVVRSKREELRDAFATRQPDAIIVTLLGLVQVLLDEHRFAAAASELETVIAVLEAEAPPQLWRLQLTLAAVYDGVGEPERGRTAAHAALELARTYDDRVGMKRARAVLQRLRASSLATGAR